MEKQLETIKTAAKSEIESAISRQVLEALRVKYLGKKGELTSILKQMGSLSPKERPIMGALANEVRGFIGDILDEKMKLLAKDEQIEKLKSEAIDVTIPGNTKKLGSLHPLTVVLDEVKEIFLGMGFQIATGPEVEWDYYNFEALNIPKDHPARDTQDTFYITENMLLRTQTSPVQIRVMENTKPPIRIIAPGRVYRADTVDATHSPLFHQVEGLVVDKGISMSVLKGSLMQFAKRLYGNDTKIRLRPHHFPFTEPSCEMDVSCFICGGKGCSMCKNEGWIEILGAGMVHPKVLENGGIDPNIYSGYAFGVGLERLTLFKYSINDLRLFFENDLRFLSQF
ncbi:MAG: phenylalanine--tRNA ligase subunit alpha [Clostridiales bacterium]|jgi:phenylalanyl-tRNA synthetase alpha chain|nr:phenylalanine--tRNA ligase subunit alpha [Clostridiales bacterium]